MDKYVRLDIAKIVSENRENIIDSVITEGILNINVNRKFYGALMCTPEETLELAIGFLYSEGVITSMKSIKSIEELENMGICIVLREELPREWEKRRRAQTSGCASGSIDLELDWKKELKTLSKDISISAMEIFALMREFNNKSELFKETGGVHSCALCKRDGIINFSEDIGRHNALDKVIGKSVMMELDLRDKILLTTGRISSEIIIKAARAEIPIIISHSAPTELAVNIARELNIIMLGFVRGNRMNVYSGFDRVRD